MKHQTLTALALLSLCSTALAARPDAQDANLTGAQLCIDENSFSVEVGALSSVSQKVVDAVYDYFLVQAKKQSIKYVDSGKKACSDYAVNIDVYATTGTPRAWLGEVSVTDSSAFILPDAKSGYPRFVSVWATSYYGVLKDNVGLSDYFTTSMTELIDELFKAYKKVN